MEKSLKEVVGRLETEMLNNFTIGVDAMVTGIVEREAMTLRALEPHESAPIIERVRVEAQRRRDEAISLCKQALGIRD